MEGSLSARGNFEDSFNSSLNATLLRNQVESSLKKQYKEETETDYRRKRILNEDIHAEEVQGPGNSTSKRSKR